MDSIYGFLESNALSGAIGIIGYNRIKSLNSASTITPMTNTTPT